ncbi:MAG TPA: hypothetical protein VIN06_08145, partial [Devosia sp.]
MVEEERLDDELEEVDEVIVAADVGEFVDEDRLDLVGRQRGEEGGGDDEHRFPPAEDGGNVDLRGGDEADGARDLQLGAERVEAVAPVSINNGPARVAEVVKGEPAEDQLGAEDEDAHAPREDEIGEDGFQNLAGTRWRSGRRQVGNGGVSNRRGGRGRCG